MAAQNTISNQALNAIAEEIAKPHLTMNDYRLATETLYQCALQGTGTSRAAAQLLLSAYNGSNWHVDLTDLCMLDGTLQIAAMDFIECRITIGEEPQMVMENGDKKFRDLQQQWRRYHVNNRWKTECWECHGIGQTYANLYDETDDSTMICSSCKGTGLLAEVKVF